MNNEDNYTNYDIAQFEAGTVGDYLELLLSAEAQINRDHNHIKSAKSVLEQLVPETLTSSASKFNLAVFLLSLHKKDKESANYYAALIRKYSLSKNLRKGEDHQNVFALIDELLNDAKSVVHPDNEIDKYFEGGNYAFAVGLKVEEFYKYIPDQSLQELIQETMRRRVAFMMTLLQLRTEKYGTLKDIYLNNGIYSREISLCILFHTLVISLNSPEKNLIEKYKEIKKYVLEDIKIGKLQLPDKRLFQLKSLNKRRILEKEFNDFFLNEYNFKENKILNLLSSYEENYEKILTQIFPVVAVRDPISGKVVKINLTKYGTRMEEMQEVDIPRLYVLNEDVEDYVRRQLARKISNNPDVSLEVIVKEVLHEKNLDSDATIKSIVDTLRPNIYAPMGWHRKFLFWLDNFDSQKTFVGNLASFYISNSLFPSSVKESLEHFVNVKASTMFSAALGLGIGGIPAAVVLISAMLILNRLTKIEKNEVTFSKGFLNGVLGYTKKDLSVLAINGYNPYLPLLKFIVDEDKYVLKDFRNIFVSADYGISGNVLTTTLSRIPIINILFKNKYAKYYPVLNNIGVNSASTVQYGLGSVFSIIKFLGLKLGVTSNSFAQNIRKSKENIEIIRNLSLSNTTSVKKNEAFDLLKMFAKKSAVFGYSQTIVATSMLKELTQKSDKQNSFIKLGVLFGPNYGKAPGESFLYSWSGRTLQKLAFTIGDNLNIFAKNRGLTFVQNLVVGVGSVAEKVSKSVTNIDGNAALKKGVAGFIVLSTGIVALSFINLQSVAPLIVANKIAYGSGGNGTAEEIVNPFPGNGQTTSGLCPLEGTLSCAQGPLGSYTHATMHTDPVDITSDSFPPFPQQGVAFAVANGIIKFAGNACKDQNVYAGSIISLLAENGDTIEYFHIDYKQAEFKARGLEGKTVKQGEEIGPLFNLPKGQTVDNCWDGEHLHIQAKNSAGKYYNAELLTINNWKCNLPKIKDINLYCSDGDLQ